MCFCDSYTKIGLEFRLNQVKRRREPGCSEMHFSELSDQSRKFRKFMAKEKIPHLFHKQTKCISHLSRKSSYFLVEILEVVVVAYSLF